MCISTLALLVVLVAGQPPALSQAAVSLQRRAVVSPEQHELYVRTKLSAARWSHEDTELLTYLDSASFRQNLTRCCPSISDLSAAELQQLFVDQVRASEITHNFKHKGGWDISVSDLWNASHVQNLWELYEEGEDYPGEPELTSEVEIYGFRSFANWSEPTVTEAAGRLVYVALNWLRTDLGLEHYGDVSVVLRPSMAHPVMLLAPVDSGIWELQCNTSTPKGYDVDCTAVSNATVRRTGVMEDFKHLIMPCHKFWKSTRIVDLLFARWYGKETVMLSEYDLRSVYLEGGVAGQLPLPSGVRFVLASVPALFGTDDAEELRAVCAARGWPLLWGLGTNDHGRQLAGYSVATRIIDPNVSQELSLNISMETAPAAREAFRGLWQEAQQARSNGTATKSTSAFWDKIWRALTGTVPASTVYPLNARQCQDTDNCIGVTTSDSECVCLHRHDGPPHHSALLMPSYWQSNALV